MTIRSEPPATFSIDGLSLAERSSLGSGADFWSTKAVGAVESVAVSDGPHGLRKQDAASGADHLGIGASVPATCFPPLAGLGQSWDPELVREVGAALGEEAQAEGVGVLLGPGINIKRDPRCGRNFEYFSEDPLVSGVLGAAWVDGVQSRGVGASLKHFAANNAEHDRMRSSSDIDPRPLREIYLRAFQRVVETASPWTLMCSYNRINGEYVAESSWLLGDVLRGEWGFDGLVISDWGAVRDRIAAVAAGVDLEMPGGNTAGDSAVAAAVRSGELDAAAVDRSAAAVAQLAARVAAGRKAGATYDQDAHHALARKAAGRSIVLLKNDDDLLPLQRGEQLAVIGEFALTPRYQGGGSSHVNATRVDVPLDEIQAANGDTPVVFAPGFTTDGSGDLVGLRSEAVAVAAAARSVVLFLGLAARQESEGFDREHLELPPEQLTLLAEVLTVQPRTVVVLSHGGVLRLAPVAATTPAILDANLLGQAGGGAVADVLYGTVNPSGRLTETVPVRLEDAPSYLNFPGENSHVRYGEGLFVGYRGYDARDLPVTYPFGHGLSYTSFEYSEVTVESPGDELAVSVEVTNTGTREGRETVQVYLTLPTSAVTRPPRELKGFAAVTLAPGEAATVTTLVSRQDLAYWEPKIDAWLVEGGTYDVFVGASSRDLRAHVRVEIAGDDVRLPLTPESSVHEVLTHPVGAVLFGQAMGSGSALPESAGQAGEDLGMDMVRMMGSVPVGRMAALGGPLSPEQLDALLTAANA